MSTYRTLCGELSFLGDATIKQETTVVPSLSGSAMPLSNLSGTLVDNGLITISGSEIIVDPSNILESGYARVVAVANLLYLASNPSEVFTFSIVEGANGTPVKIGRTGVESWGSGGVRDVGVYSSATLPRPFAQNYSTRINSTLLDTGELYNGHIDVSLFGKKKG